MTDASLAARLIALRDHLEQIINGFKSEAMNGVICLPPNVPIGNDDYAEDWNAPPSRLWCARCRSRWHRLFALPAEVEGLITALRQDPRCAETEHEDLDQSRVGGPSLLGGSDLPHQPPELASTSVENDVSRVTRFEVINETGRVYGHRPCTVQLSFQDAGRTLKVFVNWPRVNQSAASASPEEALKLARTVAAVDRGPQASTDRPRAHEVLADPILAAAPAPQDPPWQPISTAPKDGTGILGWEPWNKACAYQWLSGYGRAGWCDFSGEGFFTPTHWMPLPAAPPEAGASGIPPPAAENQEE